MNPAKVYVTRGGVQTHRLLFYEQICDLISNLPSPCSRLNLLEITQHLLRDAVLCQRALLNVDSAAEGLVGLRFPASFVAVPA
jgi:hypothetical protein